MGRMHKARITSKGQVTRLVQVRRDLGLNPGDVLIIRESATGYTLEKSAEQSRFDEYIGYLGGHASVRTDDLMREMRGGDTDD